MFFVVDLRGRLLRFPFFDERFDVVLVWEPMKHQFGISVIRDRAEPLATLSHVLEHRVPLLLIHDSFCL